MAPCKYCTNHEKIKAQKAQQNIYAAKDWKYDVWDITIRFVNKTNHLNTRKYILSIGGIDSVRIWKCDVCDIEINPHSKRYHIKSDSHLSHIIT